MQFCIVWSNHAHGLKMIGHAGRAINNTDFYFLVVSSRCVISHVSHVRETCWLKAILITYRFKTSFDDKTDRTVWLEQRFKCKISIHCLSPLTLFLEVCSQRLKPVTTSD